MLAEVNENGEVTVEGEFVGRLEGFRFSQDKSAAGQEAKTLKAASLAALTPHFHLLADRFYNAPDTEIDFTEQGGLMWGNTAVGKLVKGAEALKPAVKAFVDDEAGSDVAEKVTRRLQHFIDRKIATAFEPLLNLSRDDTLTGLARGFAFQMVEGLGLLPRATVANDVKSLDQDARSALRKHGIRFGQFTIFLPLLLKPAPTRLRLVLWSLAQDLAEFPEAPPAGLVTVPNMASAPRGTDTMAGYRNAGDRAIRIDMLERLADMLRSEDSRGGFEAKADMLSITGMTLEQFADLMAGLGYKAEKGERVKVKAAPAETAAEAPAEATAEAPTETPTEAAPAQGDTDAPAAAPAEPQAEPEVAADAQPQAESETTAEASTEAETPDMEVFYSFTWGGNRGGNARAPRSEGDKPRGKGKPQGKPRGKPQGGERGKAKPQGDKRGPQSFQARPPREKAIDPDNPFAAALMGLAKKD